MAYKSRFGALDASARVAHTPIHFTGMTAPFAAYSKFLGFCIRIGSRDGSDGKSLYLFLLKLNSKFSLMSIVVNTLLIVVCKIGVIMKNSKKHSTVRLI